MLNNDGYFDISCLVFLFACKIKRNILEIESTEEETQRTNTFLQNCQQHLQAETFRYLFVECLFASQQGILTGNYHNLCVFAGR